MRAIASAPRGGGIGLRQWVINAQVPSNYSRTDIDVHLDDLARELGLNGEGVGFLTAAAVERFASAQDGDAEVVATVGLHHPTWAAADDPVKDVAVGTINIVAFLQGDAEDAALVNAVSTITEAKSQALLELGVPGTGTASDALCVLAPVGGPKIRFAGPRSDVGSRLARAVHRAVVEGASKS
jgi:adenosylcobinamide amidohydrolase